VTGVERRDLHDGSTHVCNVDLTAEPGSASAYPTAELGGWDSCREREWLLFCEEYDAERDDYDGSDEGDACDHPECHSYCDYVAAGGQRTFESWEAKPCCSCSDRHGGPEQIRPPGENTAARCLDALAEGFARNAARNASARA
jgi:hypothetical protein